MTHEVSRHLKVEVAEYDAAIRRFIPGYETMVETAAGAVAAVLPGLVLDLGAGTGALAGSLLERIGVGRVELVDVDADMLARARSRLRRYGERVAFSERSYDEPFPDCDAISASLSLHHISTLDAKKELFARAHRAIRPGGVLVIADAYMPADEIERDTLYRSWVDHMVRSGIAQQRAEENLDEWSEEDTYQPLVAEVAALGAVGFDARCVWQLGPMSVLVARRPLT